MKPETDKAICAIMGTDESITPRHAQAALSILRGEVPPAEHTDDDEILTRDEAAKRLRVTPVTVSKWGQRGIIRRVTIPGQNKCIGFSLKSVREIVNGCGEKSEGKGARHDRTEAGERT